MGHELMRAMATADDLLLAGVWARRGADLYDQDLGSIAGPRATGVTASDDLVAVLAGADVAIDFTLPEASQQVLGAVARSRTPLVCGVSGLSPASLDSMQHLSADVAVLYDRNMSLGVAVLNALVQQAAPALGPEFRVEIHDTHHEHKIDAPSGTALQLGETLALCRGQDFATVCHYEPGEDPRQALADRDAIRFVVRRVGEVPGQHAVVFSSGLERLELRHSVSERRVFAEGALRAARWLVLQGPGRYAMRDLLAN